MRVLFVGTPEEYYRSIAEREDGEPFSLSFLSPDDLAEGLSVAEAFDGLVVPALRFLSMPPDRRSRADLFVTLACGPASVADECFEAGCSDYLCEPWGEPELRARVRAATSSRRWALSGGASLDGRLLIGSGRSVILSAGDGNMLAALLANRGRPVMRATLIAVSGMGSITGRALDMRVSRLRAALRSVGAVEAARGLKAEPGAYSMFV
ncbi:MAG TPA: hypothetical protein PLI66_05315 [Spirochaetales bacterium]|nr:hypothetical protein [Spirochaetales bacterium]